jgi:hypothetical protein
MKAKTFDRVFDEGKSIVDQLDLSKARRPKLEQKRVNVDFSMDDLEKQGTDHGLKE